ncbi:MAG: DUF5985 family protein [Candidatus Sericytochromatia bacterium]
MGSAIYILCALTALGCAWLLLQSYRRSGAKLLLWSGLCFVGLTLSNFLVFIDLTLLPDLNLYFLRNSVTLVSMSLLMYGLVWDS